MPALLLPPGVHGVPVAPGPVIFPDGAFPPVPTVTSSVVPEISGTPAPASTVLPPVRGRGYVAPPGIVESEISRVLTKPADLSFTTSTLPREEKSNPRGGGEGFPKGIFSLPIPAEYHKLLEKLSKKGGESALASFAGKSDAETEEVTVELRFPNEINAVPKYRLTLPLALPDDIKQGAIDLLKRDHRVQVRLVTNPRTGEQRYLFFPDGYLFVPDGGPDAQVEPPSIPSGAAGQANPEGKSNEESSPEKAPAIQKRDADAVAADGDPEAVTEADLSIPDNQSPLRPIGNEYSHDSFWHLEQPRVRYGPAKMADKLDRFGNTPGWPIPFSVSFDEYVLKLDEPYAPPKPSLRGHDIPTGGEDWVVASKKVKRGEEIIIVPDLGVPLEKGRSGRPKKPTTEEPARKATTKEQFIGLKTILSSFYESAAAKEALHVIESVEASWAREESTGIRKPLDEEAKVAEAKLKAWLVRKVDAAFTEHKEALQKNEAALTEARHKQEAQRSEENAAAWKPFTRKKVDVELDRLGLREEIAAAEEKFKAAAQLHEEFAAAWKLREWQRGEREKERATAKKGAKEAFEKEKAPKEVPKKEEAPKEESPKEATPKEEEEGHALEPRGNGDPNFSDPRLERKKKKGKLAGTRLQEEQPLEYPFNVEPRLDNEEKEIWPFRDGFDDVAHDKGRGKMPKLCVIL